MSLKKELMEINGVGEATAEKIIAVVEKHESDGPELDVSLLKKYLRQHRIEEARNLITQ